MNKKSRGDQDSSVLRASGVSRALWPSQMRRSPATGKIAQQRRLMIIKGVWCFRKPRPFQNKRLVKKLVEFQSTFRIYLLYTMLTISLLVVGVLLAMFILHPWPVTILLGLLWTVTVALTIQLWYTCLYMALTARRMAKRLPIQHLPTIARTRPLSPMPTIPVTRPLPGSLSISRPGFPATPMPSTPLVRILETIDLSSTNVEHFLEGAQASDQQIPRSQMGPTLDETTRQAGERTDISINEETQ
jgi:hypothetical protein